MENMKTLADQIREELVKPNAKKENPVPEKPAVKTRPKETLPDILTALMAYDTAASKSMVHVRFNDKTVRTMNQFKLATGVDVTRFVSFAVKEFIEKHPEIKTIIKQFIQNSDL
jgi:hypothetical protein